MRNAARDSVNPALEPEVAPLRSSWLERHIESLRTLGDPGEAAELFARPHEDAAR